MNLADLGMVAEELGDEPGIGVGPLHPSASVSSERPSIQQENGSSCVPTLPRSALIGPMVAFAPSVAPAIRSE